MDIAKAWNKFQLVSNDMVYIWLSPRSVLTFRTKSKGVIEVHLTTGILYSIIFDDETAFLEWLNHYI